MGIRSRLLRLHLWRSCVAPTPSLALCRILSWRSGSVISRQRLDCVLAPRPSSPSAQGPLDGHSTRLCSVAPSRGTLSCPCPASSPAQGSNASSFALVAPSATLASSTLAVSSAREGTASHTPPGSCATMVADLAASAPEFAKGRIWPSLPLRNRCPPRSHLSQFLTTCPLSGLSFSENKTSRASSCSQATPYLLMGLKSRLAQRQRTKMGFKTIRYLFWRNLFLPRRNYFPEHT